MGFVKGLSGKQKAKLWDEVKREFPGDPALQEVHFARLYIDELTKDMSSEKRRKFIKALARGAPLRESMDEH